jgi:hypothetical protein
MCEENSVILLNVLLNLYLASKKFDPFYPKNTFGRPQSTLPTTAIIQFDRQSILGETSAVWQSKELRNQ